MTDLSILIPARNEMFLKNTIDDVLRNMRGDTEIIVILDGSWPIEPIPLNDKVHMIYHSEAVGQRAATNEAAKISTAKYVMKCDAHCSFGEGFDVIMMEDMQDDWTMVPKMYNLHVFDWVCDCGHRRYQGPTPEKCEKCGGMMEREILWRAKPSPETTAMRFDNELRFKYWSGYKKRQGDGDLVDTMSLLGACWMATREKYWELELCDEGHGGWGQMGTEVACKTWLSGGRLVCNRRTWFAHMFRTQGGDFGFPYPIKGSEVNKAREYSRKLWIEGNWDKAEHDLDWLIDKFAPVPDWDVEKEILYYTDNRCDKLVWNATQRQLAKSGLPIISVSLEPIDFGRNIVLDLERGYLTMFKQILAGLEASTADIIFFAEHDVLYHPSHFEFVPPRDDMYYYNENTWKVDYHTGHALFYYCKQTSGLCAKRKLLLEHYRKRVKIVEEIGYSRKMGFEPGTHGRKERVDDYKADKWMSEFPNIDIRHNQNLTPNRWRKDQFRHQRFCQGWTEAEEVPGWGRTKGQFDKLLVGILTDGLD